MSSRIPCSNLSNSKTKSVKRLNAVRNFASPEKKQNFLGKDGRSDSLRGTMPPPARVAPLPISSRLRRSTSMNHLALSKRTTIASSSSIRGSTQNLSMRSSSIAASTLSLNKKRPTAGTSQTQQKKMPLVNTTKENTTGTKPARRPQWDLKGRLQDLESKFKMSCDKISENDDRIANLETEKQQITKNLVETQSYSISAKQTNDTLTQKLQEETELKEKFKAENSDLQRQVEILQKELEAVKGEYAVKAQENITLKLKNSQQESQITSLTSTQKEQTSKVDELTQCNNDLKQKADELYKQVLQGEYCRRRLHNMVQELKGNIRVFCRIRPLLASEVECDGNSDQLAHINILDNKSIELNKSPGNRQTVHEFSFDRLFGPQDNQSKVFEEISQLAQSSLDGYNVCVFAYGQTGSGKTFTMEGDMTNEDLHGMIPRTVNLIFDQIEDLKSKGWEYTLTASYLEIYNEIIRDLLADPRHVKQTLYDIRLVDANKPNVFVTNLKIVPVDSVSCVHHLLNSAQQNRSVAATNMNERSSRSHSVFQLRISGKNNVTNEACQGTLNLVDLAGSERLKQSKSEGIRLTETQAINKSLSNLGNVIMALAKKQNHIPYRNSTLTYLLQNSLGGNSKTLMFVNVSPSLSSFNETVNSLRFATKVNECYIGTARQAKK